MASMLQPEACEMGSVFTAAPSEWQPAQWAGGALFFIDTRFRPLPRACGNLVFFNPSNFLPT